MDQSSSVVLLMVGGCLALTLLAACSQKTRSIFFDGAAEGPPPPTTRVRRDLIKEIDKLEQELAQKQTALEAAEKAAREGKGKAAPSPAAEKAKTWEEAAKLLPKDSAGQVDWVQALDTRAVAPRPTADPEAPEPAMFDLDVEFARTSSKLLGSPKVFAVIYRHADHTQWLRCNNCHPAIFPLKRDAKPAVVTMAKIQAGEYCGACHGKVAFAPEQACGRCHQGLPSQADWRPPEEPRTPIERAASWADAAKLLPVTQGTPDWVKALADGVVTPRPGLDATAQDQPVMPLDVELVPKDNPGFKVVYPHEAHTQWLSCDNCHTGIFKMAKGANPITMDKIFAGKYCGACHGKVAFPLDACGRCHVSMAGGS